MEIYTSLVSLHILAYLTSLPNVPHAKAQLA